MRESYELWKSGRRESTSGHSLYEIISKAQREHLKEIRYYEGGREVTIRLEALSPRTPEMMY